MKVVLKTIIYKKLGSNGAIENKYKFYKMVNNKKLKFYKNWNLKTSLTTLKFCKGWRDFQ